MLPGRAKKFHFLQEQKWTLKVFVWKPNFVLLLPSAPERFSTEQYLLSFKPTIAEAAEVTITNLSGSWF